MTPVLVVGAGPVGLSAALALRAHGLPAVLLEAEPEDRARPGSRALFVHRETLGLLDAMRPGLAAEITSYGRTWHTRRTLYRGREVYSRTFPPPSGPPPFTSLRQTDTERFLRAACAEAGVEFVWGARVTGVSAGETEVRLTGEDGRVWSGAFAIAADGARSTVRRELGIALEGTHGEGFHVVVDVADVPGAELPLERVFHYEHPGVGGRSVMRVPFTGGFQVDLQCRDDDRPEEFGTEEAVRRWLPSVVGDGYGERILWVSTYRFLRKVAASFTDPHRRVLLAGEAAHLFPPFGARGMNSGIADAAAAAEAIAAGTGEAVAGFAEVRRAAGLFNSAAAGAALDHLRPRRRIVRVRQRTAAALAPVLPWCGSWLEHAPYGPRHGAPAVAGRKY
ncbi:putative 3-(3-hydroxy-phenyl)propionate/3-hydroxycinnamic acid hydroxylase [Streptomyces afghaniensis 772]|uniref:Putative 3-(3-hydroxy-phenyl)propionate/3-hydroxycinnamic acid hydroxylase n=1 Tax=Streptomyces afghaniensis 772 TaxID=1283301 RepID=S4MN26_9ACTN|nr:FAD-dependent monooxygenase [Streptomyces afghaniensis]EPJ38081.1 putative 3-(3-hydroxy-phenyl)propionate/3-hydroxycinnamic acid hydroxylase [Streptomyces afghaniensis 772]